MKNNLMKTLPMMLIAVISANLLNNSTAKADLITWGAAQNITVNASDVSTNGTLVTGRNVSFTGSALSPTVNGVVFSSFVPTGWTNGTATALNSEVHPNTAYGQLLTSQRATAVASGGNPTGQGGIRLDSLGALVNGNLYEIQVWYADQRAAPLNDRRITLNSATGVAGLTGGEINNLGSLTIGTASGFLDADPDNLSTGSTTFGQFAIGTFTRTSSNQLWLMIQGSHPLGATNTRPNINGFQIRDLGAVPEPSSALMVGLVGMSLSLVRRRNR